MQVANLERTLASSMRKMLDDLAEDVDYLAARVKHPRALMREAHAHVDDISEELAAAMEARVLDARRIIREYVARLRPPSAIAREVRIRTRELSRMMAQAMTLRAHHLRAAVERASASLIRERHGRGREASRAARLAGDATRCDLAA